MSTKFSKAPISELIFGVVFNSNILSNEGYIFELITSLMKNGYTNYQTQPAIFEEEWSDNKLSVSMDYEKAGFSLYRLYSIDGTILIQIQQNCILLNWIRKDDTPVGNYPGFTSVYQKFTSLINEVIQKISEQKFLLEIKNLTLTYHDRVILVDNELNDILNLTLPSLKNGGNTISTNNIISKFILPCEKVNGFDSVSINTGTDYQDRRILVIENRVKGKLNNYTFKEWFNNAHSVQVDFFENLFTTKTLQSWQ